MVSAFFIYFALRGQHWGLIRKSLGEANYWYLLPALVLYFTGVWVRALRWSVLLRPLTSIKSRDVLPITAVGYMANNVLPLRTGEVVRSFVLCRKTGVTKSAGLATIAIERLFDGITLLGFILVSATVVSFTSDLRHLALVAFCVFAVLLIGLIVLTVGGDIRDRMLQVVVGPLPAPVADRVEAMAESFLSGLGVMTRKKDLALVAGASVVAWLFEASTYFMVSRAFGADIRTVMTAGATLLTTGVGNLATLVPASPGYIGPFEAAVVLVLNGALNVTKEGALSYAIVLHALLYFPVTLWGGFEWWRSHLSLKQVESMADEQETPPAEGARGLFDVATVGAAPDRHGG